jgi:hypothetical protein
MRWFEGLQMIEIGSSQYEVWTKTPRTGALLATGAGSKGAHIICAGPASNKIVALLARSFFCSLSHFSLISNHPEKPVPHVVFVQRSGTIMESTPQCPT